MLQKFLSLASVVLLVGWMFYFFVGSLPLLLLKHDNPTDTSFVRNFFNVHYLVLMAIGGIGTLALWSAGDSILALESLSIAVFAVGARTIIVNRMNHFCGEASILAPSSLNSFRRLHIVGIALNIFVLGIYLIFGVPSVEKLLL